MNIYIFQTVEHNSETIESLKNSFVKYFANVHFTDSNDADYIISFGGDGTLLDCFQRFGIFRPIIPIRDYNRCNEHEDFVAYAHPYTYLNFDEMNVLELKYKDVIGMDNTNLGISEIVIRNKDITKAARFQLTINNIEYASNIIGDGIIFCTPLGSTGYFKNITNTFFQNGIGIGFINNTQRMSNFIVNQDKKISVTIERGDCLLSIDHKKIDLKEGSQFFIKNYENKVKFINYKKLFMCSECRNKRHAVQINDIYQVI